MGLERRLRGIIGIELAAAGLALAFLGSAAPKYLQPPAPGRRAAVPHTVASTKLVSSSPIARSAPVSISVPELGISSPFGPARGLNDDGTVNDAPLSGPIWSLPWWYDRGSSPGQAGSAVLLGHVDSAAGAGHRGVFFRLGQLTPGDPIIIQLANGTVSRWTTASTALYDNTNFPDSTVYRSTGRPTLQLVTCGGSFDWHTHEYQSSVVVTAYPAPPSVG